MLLLGIIFTVTGVIATVWGLLGLGGRLPEWATKNHPPARVGLIIGIVLVVVGVVLLVVALR
jgi:multisubunit Na+/H+ antiporter MnhG subunit